MDNEQMIEVFRKLRERLPLRFSERYAVSMTIGRLMITGPDKLNQGESEDGMS